MKVACQRALWLCQALMPCAADSPGLQRRPEAAGMSPYCPSTHIGCEGGVPQGEGTQIRKRPLKHQAWAQLQGSEGGLPPLLGSGWGQARAARALVTEAVVCICLNFSPRPLGAQPRTVGSTWALK